MNYHSTKKPYLATPGNKSNDNCHVSPGELWPGEIGQFDQTLTAVARNLRCAAYLLERAIGKRKHRSPVEKLEALAFVSFSIGSTMRSIEQNLGESLDENYHAAISHNLHRIARRAK